MTITRNLAAALLMFLGLTGVAQAAPSVTVGGVVIKGSVSPFNAHVNDYFAIPYATAARWSPPVSHAPLNSPFDASGFKTATVCPQPGAISLAGTTLPQSEDCLTLSVHVPATATPASKLPVLFWIHGGSLTTGSGLEYFPEEMVANHNIVFVAINYRLGALGWFAHPAVQAVKASFFQNIGDAGNYGLMDQQFALQWVRKNIAAFGGDPKKVTIAGESAGGLSVGLNLASTTTAKGLFRGAIIESGAYLLHAVPTQSSYAAEGAQFAAVLFSSLGTIDGVNCANLTPSSASAKIARCLKGATAAQILSAQSAEYGSFGISPDSGTKVVPNGLQQAFTSATAHFHVPVMQGSNANEGRLFEPGAVPFPNASFATVVAAGGPANYDLFNANVLCGTACTYAGEVNLAVFELGIPSSVNTAAFEQQLVGTDYPLTNFPDPYLAGNAPSSDEALSQIISDFQFSCNAVDSNTDLAAFAHVYAYEFNDPEAPPLPGGPAVTIAPNDQYGFPTASEHAAELQFLFDFSAVNNLSTTEQQLAAAMQTYWANFVTNLDPNTGGSVTGVAWPLFGSQKQVQNLAPGAIAPFGTFAASHFCQVWEPILAAE
jgi:para-nitrobenzyl esterase